MSSKRKFAVGDSVEFYMSLRDGWVTGFVADVSRKLGYTRYRCQTPDFPEHGCSAWLTAHSMRACKRATEKERT